MSDINKDDILNAVNYQLQQAESYYSGILETNFQEAYYIYESDPAYYQQRFPILSRMIGDIQTADVASKVEWSMPSLLKIFLGSDAIVTITGRHPQDVENAQKMQKLINWQITTQNDGFMTFYKWFKDALITGVGYLKAYWDRVYEDIKQKEIIDNALLDTYKSNPNISEVQVVKDFGNGLLEISYKIKQLKRNQPVLEHIPVWELLYVPDGHSLSECSFIAHRKTVTGDYLRRMAKQGIYKNVEEAIEGGSGQRFLSQLEYLKDPMKRFGIQSYAGKQDAGKQIVLYECYTKYDINDDGLLENVIITVAGNNILRIQENIYSRPPFFMISPLPDIHRIGGRGFSQMVGNYQHIKTALVRQSLLTIALGNVPKLLVDPASVYLEDLEQNKLYIRQKPTGNPQPVKPIYTVASMTGAAFNFLEYIETQIENESGITRYNQGLQADSLNKRIDINTPVPMADGTWKLLRDIEDGDIILGGDGKPTKVIKAHDIALCEDSYKLEFQNGAVIYADAEHLWGVYVYDKYQVLTTKEIYELINEGKPIYVPRPERILSGEKKDLPIDPYVLGVWLGDGHKYSARITTADEEIIERVKAWCEEHGWAIKEDKHQNSGKAKTYIITSIEERKRDGQGKFIKEDSFIRRLTDLGIFTGRGGEPHIPSEYFTASYEQRLELLRGLMDTDGCWSDSGIAIFSTSNYRLAEDVVKLIRSLGGNPHLKQVKSEGKVKVCGQECNARSHYQVKFNIVDNPFYITRKADKWKPPKRQKTYRIISVKPAEPRYMRCLTVDNPNGLWLVGEQYITTHNTATGIQMIMGASNQRLEMIARIFAETGIKELMRFLIELNQLFIDQRMMIKLLDSELEIDPSDLEGNFDLEINTGVGLVQKETTIQTLQQVLQLQTQLMQIGIVTPQNLYNTAKKLLEELGYKNTSEFLTDPSLLMNGGMYGQGAVLQPGAQGTPSEGLLQLLTGGLQANQGDALQQMAAVGQYGMAGNQGGTGLT